MRLAIGIVAGITLSIIAHHPRCTNTRMDHVPRRSPHTHRLDAQDAGMDQRGTAVSDQTKAALDAAIAAHVSETGDGDLVTDWALIAATTSVENIGTGTTRYLLEGNDN